jgi:hypothetical protein
VDEQQASASFVRCFMPEEKYLISLFADFSKPNMEMSSFALSPAVKGLNLK